ncbi:hypothetical protein MASR1M12_24720 [Erysipelotrichia bacterium]
MPPGFHATAAAQRDYLEKAFDAVEGRAGKSWIPACTLGHKRGNDVKGLRE